MKIRVIADENISWRIKKLIPDWDILPSNEIDPGKRMTDSWIWNFARQNNYSILTFDEDFFEIQNIHSFPPKIIWLRTGNISTRSIAERLKLLESEIKNFLGNEEMGIYEIYL
jgi:predicted nuclease of predicted toxin-antitoxin system